VLTGERLQKYFPSATTDSRAPDLVIVTNDGVIYTKPHDGKLTEHGGFHDDDTSVALLLSNPKLAGKGRRIDAPVMTTEVAPTLVKSLGIAPDALQAVQRQGTGILPAVTWNRTAAHAIAQNASGDLSSSQ
jgi:arylsulfatase A-like enzyme